jgi:hypothetical protein
LPITTVFDPDYSITTSLSILNEWIADYLPTDVYNITNESIYFDENYILTKPMVHLQVMNGFNRNVGIGGVINQTQKAQFKNMDIMCWIYVDNNVGGLVVYRQAADVLDAAIRKNGYLLGRAGLTNPRISSFREFPKDPYSPIFGGRAMISFRVLCTYDG